MKRLQIDWQSTCLASGLALGLIIAGCGPDASAKSLEVPPKPAKSLTTDSIAAPDAVKPEVISQPLGTEIADATPSKSKTQKSAEQIPRPMLEGWTKPNLTIVLSGEQNGYLEPCGCSAKQSGGFARRANLFDQLRAKGWQVTAFDLGGTLKRSRRHDQLKFEKIEKGLQMMKYAALGLGPAELRLGAEQLLALHQPEMGMGFVSSNVILFGSNDIGTPLPFRVIELEGVKVGVTGVLSEYYRDQVLPRDIADPNPPISVAEPVASLKSALSKMNAFRPDIRVLLSYCKVDESRELATKFPEFDIIITAGGPEEPLDRAEQVGKSLLVQVGGKGKHVAVLGYYAKGGKTSWKYELIDLDKYRFKNSPAMEQLMKDFQDRLADEKLAETEKPIPHETGFSYVGAKKCGECHKKAFAKWSTTKHAHAYESLTKGRPDYEGNWVPRTHDMECLACHVTGWNPREVFPYETGFVSPSTTPHLLGQQCENCHGPGSEHVIAEEAFKKTRKRSPTLDKMRAKIHMDRAMAQKETGCYKCHDGDNSPKFNFEEYFKQIQHPWRD